MIIFKNNKEYINGIYYNNYIDTCTLENGQTIKIEFYEDWSKSKFYYGIYLVIMNKRKSEHKTTLKTTGHIGIKGLLWAKQKIKEFEEFIKQEREGVPIIIYCQWEDNRRRNVYERGLRDLGYKFGMVFGQKALYKNVQ